jgi:phosphoglycolate phosphatase
MSIRGILFDKDGTLIDFNATWLPFARLVCQEAAGGDKAFADTLMRRLGYDASIDGFLPGSPMAAGSNRDVMGTVYPDLLPKELDARIAASDRAAAEHAERSAVAVPGIASAVRALRTQGLRLGVATNDAEFGARKGIAAIGLDGVFDAVIGYDSVPHAKPAPDMVFQFARLTGLEPREIAVVGDNTHDLEMARTAGAGLAIGVLSGNGTQDVLEPLADVIVESVAKLPDFFAHRRDNQTAPEGAA